MVPLWLQILLFGILYVATWAVVDFIQGKVFERETVAVGLALATFLPWISFLVWWQS